MLTFILLGAGAIVVIAVIFLVLNSGTKGGRHNQSGVAAVNKQVQNNNPRGDVRASGSAND